MKLAIVLTAFVVLAITLVGCSDNDVYTTPLDENVGIVGDATLDSDAVILEEAEDQFIADEDFVELGEMI